MVTPILFLVGGFILLIKGADWLVEGSADLARRFKISDLVIGLTVVSFGTSAPELIVNIFASFQGSADIAIGNVVGSNISNTFFILGASALVAPLAIQRSTVIKEIPLMLLASLTLLTMANDRIVDGYAISELSRSDGIAFLGFFIIFIYYTFGLANGKKSKHKTSKPQYAVWLSLVMFVVGLIGLGAGGHLAVEGAKSIAFQIGISEALVGLTIVALGTSLPELAASVVAAKKGNTDIAVGNVVGSNIFNIYWILGLSAVIKPLPFQAAANFDLMVVGASAILLFFLVHNGQLHRRIFAWWKQDHDYVIRRWEGTILLTCYVGYIGYIIWRDLMLIA